MRQTVWKKIAHFRNVAIHAYTTFAAIVNRGVVARKVRSESDLTEVRGCGDFLQRAVGAPAPLRPRAAAPGRRGARGARARSGTTMTGGGRCMYASPNVDGLFLGCIKADFFFARVRVLFGHELLLAHGAT